MERRTFLVSVASAGVVGVAGCSSNGGDGSDDSDDGADGSDDGGTSDDGSNGTDDGGASDDGTDDGEPSDDGGSEQQTLGESFQWQDSFVAEMSLDSGEVGQITIRSNGGNYHQTLETNQGTFDIYMVDGETYLVQGGNCIRNPGGQVPSDTDAGIDPQDEEAVTGGQTDITPSGRETIDGEEMYVYEYTSEGQTVTLYVSVQTGYLRRVEFDQGRIDYRSWGEVDPITPPDMQCQDLSGG